MAGCIVAVAVTMLTAGSALGYFTTTGAGLASASVSSLSKPAFKTVSAGSGGSVTLNWGAVTAPGAGTVDYYLTRDGAKVAGNCPNAGSPAAGTVCIDKEVPLGTHSYVVTAVWSTWSAASAPESATVTAGPAAGLVLTASSTTPTAGTGVNLTITAQDSFGNTATTYAGSKSLTFSGALASPGGNAPTVTNASGTAVAFGTATPITFTSGVASISGTKNGVMTLYKSAAANISVTDGTISTASPLAVTVANATPSKLVLAAETSTPAVGAADPLTITAFDVYGNTATTYAGSKSLTFSGALASPGGNAPTVSNASGTAVAFGTATPITFSSGVASISGTKNGVMTLYKSAAANITVSDGTLTSAAVTVTPPIGATSKAGPHRVQHDPDRRGRRQPDDHRPGRLRQHRDHLHRLQEPHLLGRRGEPRRQRADGQQRLGHGGRLRHRDRDHLHLRRGEHLGHQKRRHDPLQERRGEHLGHRRHDLHRLAAGGHGRQRDALQTRPRRRKLDSRRRRRRPPDDHSLRHLRQHRHHLHRLQEPHLLGRPGEPRRQRADGHQRLGHGGRLRHRDPDHLQLRRGEHLGHQKRRHAPLQERRGEHLGQPTAR